MCGISIHAWYKNEGRQDYDLEQCWAREHGGYWEKMIREGSTILSIFAEQT